MAREAHRIMDDREREELEERMAAGQFTLDDFKGLLEKMARPGLMQKMLALMPGMGDMRKMLQGTNADGEMQNMIGVINSMTPAERRNPKIIDTPRRHRIAKGAGNQPAMITQLIKQFGIMAPLMQMATGKGAGDRMQMLQQLQQSMMNDPSMGGIRTKGSTGKRLTPKERERMQKEREKQLRKLKRKKN
jgi:signal recognition particle subunit SRP54